MGTDFVEFRQLQEVGIFSYLLYSLAKNHVNGYRCSKAEWPCVFQFQRLGLSEKLHMVAMNSAEPKVSLFT